MNKIILFLMTLLVSGCLKTKNHQPIVVDGSSTVYPITEAMAEEFQKENKGYNIVVGFSGTGGGFKKFCRGETDINNASRPVKSKEAKMCALKNIGIIELPVAYDGIAVVVHKDATWIDYITVEELQLIWKPESQNKVTKWSQVRSVWPDRELHLFGPGADSGTYDYFTKVIVGKEHSSRGDYTSSEDDNVLVNGISRDKGALGFFGYAYYAENKDKLKVVPVKVKNESPVTPSLHTIMDGTYKPLSRPLMIYVNTESIKKPSVVSFVEYYLNHTELVRDAKYVPLQNYTYNLIKLRFKNRVTGSIFGGRGSKVGVKLDDLLK